jgi:hypothetical protein
LARHGNVAFALRQYQPFNKARAFARRLGLKSTIEWRDYCKSGKKPIDIPSKPERYDEWVGMDDWLGTEFHFQPFKKARAYVCRLGLKSHADWVKYCASGKKPHDIPSGPISVYAKSGWVSWGHWLGTDTIATRLRQYRSFKEARKFARRLGLKSSTAWFDYCRSGEKPTDIPYNPQLTYAEVGWAGYGDWLGTGRAAPGTFRSFKLARDYVHRLGLKSKTQWNEYCASGKKPADIPAAPQAVYAEAGWAGYGDWLKTGKVATHLRQYKSFKEARAYVHGLGLKSATQWRAYCKSGKKPDDIPVHAERTYADDGWVGWGDWLGSR